MNYKDAINASQIWAARGYDNTGEAVVSVSHYGDELRWLEGWEGNWSKVWEPIPENKLHLLADLTFQPYGAKPDDQIEAEMLAALSEIGDDYDIADDDEANYFEPMGEILED